MKIDKTLLNKQIKTLSKQLDKKLTPKESEHIEGLLNLLGDIADEPQQFENGKLDTNTDQTINSLIMEQASDRAEMFTEMQCKILNIVCWIEEGNEQTFTKEAQDIFNVFYDEITEELYSLLNEQIKVINPYILIDEGAKNINNNYIIESLQDYEGHDFIVTDELINFINSLEMNKK